MLSEPERLSKNSRDLLLASDTEILVSAVSAWEIGIKHAIGRLPLPADPEKLVPGWMERTQARPLAIEHRHTLRASGLPQHHRDPFDRLLVAQAQLERLVLLTADAQLSRYDVETIGP